MQLNLQCWSKLDKIRRIICTLFLSGHSSHFSLNIFLTCSFEFIQNILDISFNFWSALATAPSENSVVEAFIYLILMYYVINKYFVSLSLEADLTELEET